MNSFFFFAIFSFAPYVVAFSYSFWARNDKMVVTESIFHESTVTPFYLNKFFTSSQIFSLSSLDSSAFSSTAGGSSFLISSWAGASSTFSNLMFPFSGLGIGAYCFFTGEDCEDFCACSKLFFCNLYSAMYCWIVPNNDSTILLASFISAVFFNPSSLTTSLSLVIVSFSRIFLAVFSVKFLNTSRFWFFNKFLICSGILNDFFSFYSTFPPSYFLSPPNFIFPNSVTSSFWDKCSRRLSFSHFKISRLFTAPDKSDMFSFNWSIN